MSLTEEQEQFYRQTLEISRKQIEELNVQIEEELAKVKERLADLQSRKNAARQIYDGACRILGIENDLGKPADAREAGVGMAWFRRQSSTLASKPAESRVPEGVWVKCGHCKEILYRRDVLKNLSVCPKCAFHFRIGARERLDMLFDGGWEEFDARLVELRPSRVQGQPALRRPPPGGEGQDQRLRRPGVGRR